MTFVERKHVLIALGYVAIAIVLAYVARRCDERSLAPPMASLGALSATFGLTNALDIGTVRHPADWLWAALQAAIAVALLATAVTIVRAVPRAHARSAARAIAVDGSVKAVVGVFEDVTERRNLQCERDRLLERMTLANHAGKIGVWDWDILAGTMVWDRCMFELYGIDAESLETTIERWRETLHPHDREGALRAFEAAVAGSSPLDIEFRVIWPNGEVRHIHAVGQVLRDAAGRPLRALGTNADVSEIRTFAAQRAAQEAGHAKSDCLVRMRNVIRTPTNEIMGFTTVLLDGELTSEQRRQLECIEDAGRSLLAIADDMLDSYKIEPGKLELPATAAAVPVTPGLAALPVATRRILVADDCAIDQSIVEDLLRRDGHDVVVVNDGAAAVDAVLYGHFDLVLMDMQIPLLNGVEATSRIRALRSPQRSIPIVALTANAMADQVARCRAAGMNDHLTKPTDRDLLRRTIAKWTDRDAPLAPDEANPASPALGVAHLLDVFEGDTEAVADLLNAALASIRTDLTRLERAIRSGDATQTIETAHRIKGTSGSIHAGRVLELSSAVERAARRDPPDFGDAPLTKLRAAVGIVGAEVQIQTKILRRRPRANPTDPLTT